MNHDEKQFTEALKLQHEGDLNEAIVLFQALINKNSEHIEALHNLGLVYAQLGDMQNAITYFLRVVTLTPSDPVIHNNLANAYKNQQHLEKAVEHYQKAIELSPNYAQAHNNLAGIYAKQALYKQSLNHYRIAVHAEPDFAAAHFNLGLLLTTHNELSAAATQFNNVLALNPDHIEARFYSGVLALEANQLDDAKEAFQHVINDDNNHVQALTNLGVIALKKDEGQIAIDYFSKALVLDNHHVEARNNLAATFMHHDRFENALMHYDVLLKESPKNCEYLYNMGVAQMALGHLTEAISHFEDLLTLDENHFAALNNLAAIYISKDERSKAESLLRRAVAANPNDKTSEHMLNALTGNLQKGETCPEYAANLFNNYALNYDEHLQKHLHYALPNHIVRVLSELNIQHVNFTLDLGCGTGLTGQVLRDISQHLEGVDIAKKMIMQAQVKGIYDRLVTSEALDFLRHSTHQYGLIVAADVLPYFGALEELLMNVRDRLSPGGHFIFSAEISSVAPWQLQPNARFSHHPDYLQQLAIQYGFDKCYEAQVVAQHQEGKPVPVFLIALKR
jgi:predicted TPR repeat methyltransferase